MLDHERQIQIYDRHGKSIYMGPELDDNPPGYRVSLRRDEKTPQEAAVGAEAQRLFLSKYNRVHPWKYFVGSKEDEVLVLPRDLNEQRAKLSIKDAASVLLPMEAEIIRVGKSLEEERLNPLVATNLESAFLVESLLPDFGKEALETYRRFDGALDQYFQWTGEEAEHRWMVKGILLSTRSREEGQLEDVRDAILDREWIAHFVPGVRMAIYASFQEVATQEFYLKMARIMQRDGAVNAAKLLRLVASDEAFHGAWYRDFTEEYAKYYPKQTEQDVYHVALHFGMPADMITPNRIRRFGALNKGLGVSREYYAGILLRVMKNYSFIDQEKARLVADIYAGRVEMEDSRLQDILLTN